MKNEKKTLSTFTREFFFCMFPTPSFLDRRKWAWSIIDSIDWAENDLRIEWEILAALNSQCNFSFQEFHKMHFIDQFTIYEKIQQFSENSSNLKFQSRCFPVLNDHEMSFCLYWEHTKKTCPKIENSITYNLKNSRILLVLNIKIELCVKWHRHRPFYFIIINFCVVHFFMHTKSHLI